MEQQQVYKGMHGSERPTAQQLELLKKMAVKNEIIQSLDREGAFELIKKLMTKYYEEQTRRRCHGKIVVKW